MLHVTFHQILQNKKLDMLDDCKQFN
jgi:hypothetical protein